MLVIDTDTKAKKSGVVMADMVLVGQGATVTTTRSNGLHAQNCDHGRWKHTFWGAGAAQQRARGRDQGQFAPARARQDVENASSRLGLLI